MITPEQIKAMLHHWLQTPPNGYFGSDYGADLQSLLLRPLSTNIADEFVQKLKRDIPLFSELDVSVLSDDVGFEKKQIYLSVAGAGMIHLNQVQQVRFNPNEEYVDADAG